MLHHAGRFEVPVLQQLLVTASSTPAGSVTLARILVNRGMLSEQEALDFLRQIPMATRADHPSAATRGTQSAGATQATHTASGGPSDPQAWRQGEEIGGFRLLDRLGSGSNGAVFLVEHTTKGGRYALKTLLAGTSEEGHERFKREAKAQLQAGSHPNVVRVLAQGEHRGQPFLVMEHVTGGDLAERLRRGRLAIPKAVTLVRDLARALTHMHAIGVLHRDIKPANILLGEDGTPKLVDFGLARFDGAESMTRTGDLLGTPAYMSPEQALGNRHLTGPRTDVYALGAILHNLVSGEPPFNAATVVDMLLQVVEKEATPLRDLRPEVSPELEAVCQRAMAKDIAKRPEAAELVESLDGVLADIARAREAAARPPRSRAPVAVIGVAFVAIALGGVAVLTASSDTSVAEKKVAELPLNDPPTGGTEGPKNAVVSPEVAEAVEDVASEAAKGPRWEIGPEDELRYALSVTSNFRLGAFHVAAERTIVFSWKLGTKKDVQSDDDWDEYEEEGEEEEEEEEHKSEAQEEDEDEGQLFVVATIQKIRVKIKSTGISSLSGRKPAGSGSGARSDLDYELDYDSDTNDKTSPFAAALGGVFSFELDASTGEVLAVHDVKVIQSEITKRVPDDTESAAMAMLRGQFPNFTRMRYRVPELSPAGMKSALNGFTFTLPGEGDSLPKGWSRSRPFPARALGLPPFLTTRISFPDVDLAAKGTRHRRKIGLSWRGENDLGSGSVKGSRKHDGTANFLGGRILDASFSESFSGRVKPGMQGRHGGQQNMEPIPFKGWVRSEVELVQ